MSASRERALPLPPQRFTVGAGQHKLPGGEVVRPPREGGMIGCPSAEVDSEPRTRLAAAAARHVNLPNEKVT